MTTMSNRRKWEDAEARLDAYLGRALKPTVTCPVCLAKFSLLARIAAEDIECPTCRSSLRVPKRFYSLAGGLTAGIVAAISYYLAGLIVLAFLGLLLITFVLLSALLVIVGNYLW